MYVPFPRNASRARLRRRTGAGRRGRAADPIGRAGIQAQYEQDVANCKKGTTGQDRSACLRGLAPPAEANRQRLQEGSTSQLQQNMLDRCNRLPQASRQDCITQMTSPTQVRGSVQGGGVLRETVIRRRPSAPPPAATPGMAPATGAPMRQ